MSFVYLGLVAFLLCGALPTKKKTVKTVAEEPVLNGQPLLTGQLAWASVKLLVMLKAKENNPQLLKSYFLSLAFKYAFVY